MIFAAFAAVAAFSSPLRAESFVDDEGVAYTYTVSYKDDARIIEGTSSNGRYRLVVKGDRVSGFVNGRAVSFRVDETVKLARIASR